MSRNTLHAIAFVIVKLGTGKRHRSAGGIDGDRINAILEMFPATAILSQHPGKLETDALFGKKGDRLTCSMTVRYEGGLWRGREVRFAFL